MNTELKSTSQLHGFARRLVAEGLMDEKVALDANVQAGKKGITVLAWMIKNKSLDPEVLINAASVEYGVPIIDIRAMDLSIAPVSLVDERLIEKHRAFPLYLRGNSFFLPFLIQLTRMLLTRYHLVPVFVLNLFLLHPINSKQQ